MNYREDDILQDLFNYIRGTYGEHYAGDKNIQLFDYWHARGKLSTIAVGTAEKYLSRYGLKEGKNKKDLLKAMHYIVLAMYADHYDQQPELPTDDTPDVDPDPIVGVDIQGLVADVMSKIKSQMGSAATQ
jgi:hypothetical protein